MFATLLDHAQDKIVVVVLYATVEMALIVLILWNGLFSYFNAKFTDYFKLKPPCSWCSRIDHIFDPGKLRTCMVLFCENHAMEISNLGFCLCHKNLAYRKSMCRDCLCFSKRTDSSREKLGCLTSSCCAANLENVGISDCDIVSEQEIVDKLVEIEGCDGNSGKSIDDRVVEESREAAENAIKEVKCSYEDIEISKEKVHERGTRVDSHEDILCLERRESLAESLEGSMVGEMERGEDIEKLRSALRSEREALQSLYAELEQERNASAVAASQTMAMINRLQEEKASMKMEALHYQRMMDEQAEYDHEALQLLNELLLKREKEKTDLQRELEFHRRISKNFESRDELMTTKGCSCG